MDANNFSRGNTLVELALARQSRDNDREINEHMVGIKSNCFPFDAKWPSSRFTNVFTIL
jgi:hypothetical protein